MQATKLLYQKLIKRRTMKLLYLAYSIPKPNLPQSMFIYSRIQELVNQKIEFVPVTLSNLYSSYLTKRNPFINIKYWGKNYNLSDIGFNLNLDVINLKKIEYPQYYFNLLFFFNVRQIRKIYLSNNCDLIHSHFVRDGIFAYWLKKKYGTPYIVTAHAYDILTVPNRNKLLKSITLKVLENSERTIFVSKSILKKAIEFGYSGKNSVIIPNGYNPSEFYSMKFETDRKKDIVIGFVGNLIKVKRAEYLPDIFKLVKKKISNAKLFIAGEGTLKPKIISKLEKYNLLNDTVFYGYLDHKKLGELYNKMNVLILPSINEGFPTVIVESLACGIPVVASDCGSNAETLKDCGITVSQQVDDFIERFAESVIGMIENPIPKDVILKIAKEYSWENIIKKEIDVYKESLINNNLIL
jgi:glycosyltransferase involved in cell wall biosynthesis